MLKGIRNLTERDRLAQRVVDLEKQVACLRAEARRNLGQTNFREVSRGFTLDSNVRDHVVARVVDDMAPLLAPHVLLTLKEAQLMVSRDAHLAPHVATAAFADISDFQVEVHLPSLTTSFRVRAAY